MYHKVTYAAHKCIYLFDYLFHWCSFICPDCDLILSFSLIDQMLAVSYLRQVYGFYSGYSKIKPTPVIVLFSIMT